MLLFFFGFVFNSAALFLFLLPGLGRFETMLCKVTFIGLGRLAAKRQRLHDETPVRHHTAWRRATAWGAISRPSTRVDAGRGTIVQ